MTALTPITTKMEPDKPSGQPMSYRVTVDTAIGTLAGSILALAITPMDQAVMEKMSRRIPLTSSLQISARQMLNTPAQYLQSPQYSFVVGTYAGTYICKNLVDTMCKETEQTPEKEAFYKFWSVLAVNGGLSVFWKDPGLARLFGKSVGPAMPKTVYASWMLRDAIHMVGATVLPDYCEQRFGWTKDQWRLAQLSFPLMTQLVTTPAHLLGLDLYNHPTSALSTRLRRIRKNWLPSSGLRMCRMFAPWSDRISLPPCTHLFFFFFFIFSVLFFCSLL